MNTKHLINAYIESQLEGKRDDLLVLHRYILAYAPDIRLWFLDGKNEEGKVIANPNIGYGVCQLNYADGSHRKFYKIGISANTTGVSIYFMGIEDKAYLKTQYAAKIGKASITGYCIKFRNLKDVNLDVLKEVIQSNL
jgi:hypothetical protein